MQGWPPTMHMLSGLEIFNSPEPGYPGPPAYPFPAIGNWWHNDWNPSVPAAIWGASYSCPSTFVAPAPSKNTGDACSCSGGEGQPANAADGKGSSPITKRNGVFAGDPINTSTGDVFRQDEDYSSNDDWLTFRRFYNSLSVTSVTSVGGVGGVGSVGANWNHSFQRTLTFINVTSPTIYVTRPDGRIETFAKANGQWTTDADTPDTLTETDNAQGMATGYTLFVAALRHFETYNASGLLQQAVNETGQGISLTYSTSTTPSSVAPEAGLLLTVTDFKERQLSFIYDSNARVHQLSLPDGGTLIYGYDTSSNLTSVQYPDGKVLTYVYNESALTGGSNLINALTGVVDEAGSRFESITYVGSTHKATSSGFAGSVGTTKITYDADGSASIQYPLGLTSKLSFTTVQGVMKASFLDQPCSPQCGVSFQSSSYDANGYPATTIDFNGDVTATTFASDGLISQQVDAQGTASQRTTAFIWNTTLRVPLTRTVSDSGGGIVSSTQWVYNTAGQTLALCDVDPTNSAASGYTCSATGTVPAGVRRSTYTYCTAVDTVQCPLVGLLLTATGPRTDVAQTTTYSYYMAASAVNCGTPGAACYQPGDLHTVTDALGHVTTLASYDADGRITRVTDANGVNTDLTYTPRGWLASRSVGGAVTKFTYMPYGAVQTITDPDGVTTTYGYDSAHRLTTITDALGNFIQYTLDAAGDKTGEQVYDSSGAVHKQLTRTFNPLGQLTSVVDGLGKTVFNASASTSYDANGNLVQSSDGLGIQRQLGYDALNRLVQTIDNYNGTN